MKAKFKTKPYDLVPAKLQDQVRELLTEDGYEILEDGTVRKKDGDSDVV